MQLYPAIDIKGGKCVRLTQGLFDHVKVYSHTPGDMARLWQDLGASFLHLVDLDGALAGRPVNADAVRAVVEAVDIPVQVGGGIRSEAFAAHMLDLGAARVIIGTKAVERPEFMAELVEHFGADRIVAGVDARDGMVAIQGWEEAGAVTAACLCMKMKEMGIRHVVYTDISRDGMLAGPNVEATKQLTLDTGIDIIASGGVSSLGDLKKLNQAGIKGVVIGKALYENRVDLREAVNVFETRKMGGESV